MRTLPLSEAKAKLSELVGQVASRDAQVLITRNGKPAAMLVSPDELESWKATVEILSDPHAMASIRRGIRDLKAGRYRTISSDRDWDELFGPAPRKRARRTSTSTRRPR